MNEYLIYFMSACNTRASAALGELTLAIARCRTYQFSHLYFSFFLLLYSLPGIMVSGSLWFIGIYLLLVLCAG